jgi:uncharacterized protein (DUF1697 family)
VKYVAFFRNMNLGRPYCPSKTQFEAAFDAAGAESAQSFLTNGTLVFAARTDAQARTMLATARQTLARVCGLKEPSCLRRLAYLAKLVAEQPFAAVDRGKVYECCVSFMDAPRIRQPALPLESKRGDVEVIRFTRGEAFSVSREVGKSPGSPTLFLEKLLGAPVTTRAWNTVVRIVEKHG